MPLSFLKIGEERTVKQVTGQAETKRFLESLGFITGSLVSVVSEASGNMIVSVKDTRIALDRSMAIKILV